MIGYMLFRGGKSSFFNTREELEEAIKKKEETGLIKRYARWVNFQFLRLPMETRNQYKEPNSGELFEIEIRSGLESRRFGIVPHSIEMNHLAKIRHKAKFIKSRIK